MALIDAATMQYLVELDADAMPSTCVIQYRTTVETPTGGTKPGGWVNRNATPLKCRFVPSGARSTVLGERLATIADGALQIELVGIKAQNVTIDDDDEISVTTVLPLPGADYSDTTRYKVSAEPFVGSYSTNLTVPVSKVG